MVNTNKMTRFHGWLLRNLHRTIVCIVRLANLHFLWHMDSFLWCLIAYKFNKTSIFLWFAIVLRTWFNFELNWKSSRQSLVTARSNITMPNTSWNHILCEIKYGHPVGILGLLDLPRRWIINTIARLWFQNMLVCKAINWTCQRPCKISTMYLTPL